MDSPDLEQIIDEIRVYTKRRSELSKMQLVEKGSLLLGTLSSKLVIFLFAMVVFFFLSIGLALLISHLIGPGYSGFMVMAGCYLLLLLLFYLNKERWLITPVTNHVIENAFDDEEDD